MENKRMGRPPKEPSEQATEITAVRLTVAERQMCEEAARNAKQRLSAWMRDRLTKAAKRESKHK